MTLTTDAEFNEDRRSGGERRRFDREYTPERRSGVDRRHDVESRMRIESLERRYRTVTELLVGTVAIALIAIVIGFIVIGQQTSTIQGSRVRALEAVCGSINNDRQGIVEFIGDVSPDLVEKAKAKFPQTTDCHAYAEDLAAHD